MSPSYTLPRTQKSRHFWGLMLNELFYTVYFQRSNLSFDVQILCSYKYLDNPLTYLAEQNLPFAIKVAITPMSSARERSSIHQPRVSSGTTRK
jgi:hypothetical protein